MLDSNTRDYTLFEAILNPFDPSKCFSLILWHVEVTILLPNFYSILESTRYRKNCTILVSWRGRRRRGDRSRVPWKRSGQKVQRARGQHPHARSLARALWIRVYAFSRMHARCVRGIGAGEDGLEPTKRNRDERRRRRRDARRVYKEQEGTKGGEMAANEGE